MTIGVNNVAWGDRHPMNCDGLHNQLREPRHEMDCKTCQGSKSLCPHVGISDRAIGYDPN